MDPSTGAPESPKFQHPLTALGWHVQSKKYKPTSQEESVLGKCIEDARWYYVNAPVAAGALVWACGSRLRSLPRVLVTISAAVVGHDFGGRLAGHSCLKNILSLKDSPLRGELIAILRRDFPNDSLLKSDLVKDEERRPQPEYLTDEDMRDSTTPASNWDAAAKIDDRIVSSFGPLEGHEKDTAPGNGEEPRRISRLWRPEPNKAMARRESGGGDLLADPFDLVMQSAFVDAFSDGAEDGVKGRAVKERRRSKMSVKERREYDRMQYQRWQEHQKV